MDNPVATGVLPVSNNENNASLGGDKGHTQADVLS